MFGYGLCCWILSMICIALTQDGNSVIIRNRKIEEIGAYYKILKKFIGFCFGLFLMGIVLFVTEENYHWMAQLNILSRDVESNRKKLIEEIREGFIKGEENIVVKCMGDNAEVEAFVMNAPEEVFLIDEKDTSSDYDYLKYKYKGMSVSMKGYGKAYVVTYEFQYLESREQTEQVDNKVKKVLQKMKLDKKTDEEKIKIIHDYIVKNTEYDLTASKNCAYNALIDGISACQGYASLAYKMLTEAGIDCRIIGGTASGEPHAWNLVKLDGLWYNLDCTWDDPVGSVDKDYVSYDYYLKSDASFSEHKRDKEYQTKEFYKSYKMSEEDYQ